MSPPILARILEFLEEEADDAGFGYPLVDLMSNDGCSIATGEAELEVLADHIEVALSQPPEARELNAARTKRLGEQLRQEGLAYGESLEREDGWIERCDKAESDLTAARAEIERLTRETAKFRELDNAGWFDEAAEFLDDYTDAEIIDGTTHPNKAMRLLCKLQELGL